MKLEWRANREQNTQVPLAHDSIENRGESYEEQEKSARQGFKSAQRVYQQLSSKEPNVSKTKHVRFVVWSLLGRKERATNASPVDAALVAMQEARQEFSRVKRLARTEQVFSQVGQVPTPIRRENNIFPLSAVETSNISSIDCTEKLPEGGGLTKRRRRKIKSEESEEQNTIMEESEVDKIFPIGRMQPGLDGYTVSYWTDKEKDKFILDRASDLAKNDKNILTDCRAMVHALILDPGIVDTSGVKIISSSVRPKINGKVVHLYVLDPGKRNGLELKSKHRSSEFRVVFTLYTLEDETFVLLHKEGIYRHDVYVREYGFKRDK